MLVLTLGLVMQGTPINVESPGIRLVNLIPKLAAESRLSLEVVSYMENDVVAIRTAGRPWGEVKANLAKVLNATWEEKEGRWTLTQTSEQQRADRDTRRACMEEKIRRLKMSFEPFYSATAYTDIEFNRWADRAGRKFDKETKGAARLPEIFWRRRSNPQGRLIARLLHSVEPASLVTNDLSWEFRPFSDVRLPLHQVVNTHTAEAVSAYRIESEQLRLAKDRLPSMYRPQKTAVNSSHWKLTIDETPDGQLDLEIGLFDDSGKYTDGAYDWGEFKDETHYEGLRGKAKWTKFAEERFGAQADLEPDYERKSDEVIEAALKAEKAARLLLRELCLELAKARTDDPLRLLGGDDWRLFSEEQSSPMIALLADGPDNRVVMKSHPFQPSGLFRADADGWIVGAQRDPFFVRTHRFDRTIASALMTRLAGEAGIESGDLEEIHRGLEFSYLSWKGHLSWCPSLQNLIDNLWRESYGGSMGVLYYSLGTGGRQSLLSGRPMNIVQQTDETRRAFRELLFLSGELDGTDDGNRIAPVAFPAVDSGMILTGQVAKEECYFLQKATPEGSKPSEAEPMSVLTLASYMVGKEYNPDDRVAAGFELLINVKLGSGPRGPAWVKKERNFPASPKQTSEFVKVSQLPVALRTKLIELGKKLLIDDGG